MQINKSDRRKMQEDLQLMDKPDIYTLTLFALYKLHDTKEYSTLSELSYILDDKSLTNFLKFYGGMTITIPTYKEFRIAMDALQIYQKVKFENLDFKKAYKTLDTEFTANEIKPIYKSISKVMSDYIFNVGE